MSEKTELTLGTRVRWTSSASGTTTTKAGVVVGIVPKYQRGGPLAIVAGIDGREGEIRDPAYFQSEWRAWLRQQKAAYAGDGRPWPRKDISYLVRVPGKTEKHKAKIYQPRVSALEVIS